MIKVNTNAVPVLYGAAKKAAEHWGMKLPAGIDAHLAVDEAEYGKKVNLTNQSLQAKMNLKKAM